MIELLPNEVFWLVLSHLEYKDLEELQAIKSLSKTTTHYIQQHYQFQYKINSLLRLFEAITPTERHSKDTKLKFSQQILQQICKQVEVLPKIDHRAKFTELLDIVQQFIVTRILSEDLKAGIEHDYANLCLEIRSSYLHTPSIRVLHDPVRFYICNVFLLHSNIFLDRNIDAEARNIHWHHSCQEIIPTCGGITVPHRIHLFIQDLRYFLEAYLM